LVLNELEEVAGHSGVSADPQRTGIIGWSMGGFGAVSLAIAHPHRFRAVSSIIGLLDFPVKDLPEGMPFGVPSLFGSDPAHWAAVNPLHSAEALRGMAIHLHAGRTAYDYGMNVRFHHRLLDLGIPHHYREYPTGHEWQTVAAALPEALADLDAVLQGAQRGDCPTLPVLMTTLFTPGDPP